MPRFTSPSRASYEMNYFAYGSNMHQPQMNQRCPGSKFVCRAYIEDWEFYINSRGVASIRKRYSSYVFGMIYRIDRVHEAQLDVCEGVAAGCYGKFNVEAFTVKADKARDCLTYIDPDWEVGRPRPGYMQKITTGAAKAGLPKEYISELLNWR